MGTILGILILIGILYLIHLAFWGRVAERDINAPEPDYQRRTKKRR